VSFDPTGPGRWRLEDGYGTEGTVRLMHQEKGPTGTTMVFHGRGGYSGPMAPKALTGSCLIVVRHHEAVVGKRVAQKLEVEAFLDVDGLGLEIYRDRPREQWQVRDGEVAMATDPLDLQGVHGEPGAEAPWAGLDAGTSIGHVHLHVPHLDTAEAFYCGRIGFTPTLRRYPGALFVAAGGYHHHLGLNVWAGIGAPPPPANAVGLRSFSIEATGVAAAETVDDTTAVTVRQMPAPG